MFFNTICSFIVMPSFIRVALSINKYQHLALKLIILVNYILRIQSYYGYDVITD